MGLTIRGFVKESLREFYSRLKTKLSGVAFSGNYSDLNGKPTLDLTPTENSTNPVTSGGVYSAMVDNELVVSTALNDLNTRLSGIENTTIPTKTSDLTNDSGFLTSHQDISGKANTADLATVATSGSYNDLSDKPSAQTFIKDSSDIVMELDLDTGKFQFVPNTAAVTASSTSLATGKQIATYVTNTVPAWARNSTKPTYTASEVGALPDTTEIPTESTVSGWGFTKNSGTYSKPSGGIPASDLTAAVQTSLGKADTSLQSFTETDPVFSASAAAGITSSDITNWNGKTSNTGTITGINMNGASKGTSGVVDLGTVITSHATHKLTASNGTATAVNQGTEITYVESLTGTNIATSGDLTVSTTRKKVTIPTAVTESTVSGWGFTKNAGTYSKPSSGIPKTDLASDVQTSLGKADTALQSYTETDPIFSASAAAGITASDITNWNSKTSNTGTLIGVSFNGTSATVSGGVASISATLGDSNVIESVSVNGTPQIITGKNVDITIPTSGLPNVTASDNGKILMVVNGAWALVTPSAIYSGSGTPNNSQGNDGDIYLQTS